MLYAAPMAGFAEDSAPYQVPMSKLAFLHWIVQQERRHEFVRGRPVMHPGSTKRHALLSGRFVVALAKRLDPDEWFISTAEYGVDTGEHIRYPDVLVAREGQDGAALSTDSPVVIIEVLSPSSTGTDMTEKVVEYTSLATLEAYVVASQDEPSLWLWQRGPEGGHFPTQPQQIAGLDAEVSIAALSIRLPLGEIYRRIAGRKG